MRFLTLRRRIMIPQQYELFVEKFKRKKTSDDCYTPELIYDAIRDYVAEEYSLDTGKFVRPFWPDTDYQDFNYPEGCVVVDNPPFSILAEILRFYLHERIKFFLFCPGKTALEYGRLGVCIICTNTNIVFNNGAIINISFCTNLEAAGVRSSSELYRQIKTANDKNMQEVKPQLPQYIYPPEVLTFSAVDRFSKYGIDFKVESDELFFIRQLDSQRTAKKGVYGAGFLMSEEATERRAAAERAAAERAAAERWQLSERERKIVKALGKKTEEAV